MNKKLILKLNKLKLDDNDKNNLYELNNKLKNDLIIYFEKKGNDSGNYVDKKLNKDSIFIRGGIFTLNKNKSINRCVLIYSFNSWDIKLINFKKIKKVNLELIKKNIIFNEKMNYNEDGDIIIYLNNMIGWYENYTNIDEISKLILKIRKFKKNKIIIKLHPYQYRKDVNDARNKIFIKKLDKIKNISKNIFILKTANWDDLIKNCYCIFIQNAFFMFELISYGIPIFNLGKIVNLNYYPDCAIPFEYFSKIHEYSFNRIKLLEKYFSTMRFLTVNAEYQSKRKQIIKEIISNNINYFS